MKYSQFDALELNLQKRRKENGRFLISCDFLLQPDGMKSLRREFFRSCRKALNFKGLLASRGREQTLPRDLLGASECSFASFTTTGAS